MSTLSHFFCSSFFQTRSRFYGRISTDIYDYVYLEPGYNLWCHAIDSNGISLVDKYNLSIKYWKIRLFLKFLLQREHTLLILLAIIVYASYAFGVVLIICELGQRLTNAFEEICDTIENFDWYLFPLEIQQILPILLVGTQEPVVLECFGSISGTRDTFKKVSLTHFAFE